MLGSAPRQERLLLQRDQGRRERAEPLEGLGPRQRPERGEPLERLEPRQRPEREERPVCQGRPELRARPDEGEGECSAASRR